MMEKSANKVWTKIFNKVWTPIFKEKIMQGFIPAILLSIHEKKWMILMLKGSIKQIFTPRCINPIPNRSGHVIYTERVDSALTW